MPGSISSSYIAAAIQLADGVVTNPKLATDAVSGTKVANKGIIAGKIDDNVVGTAQILDSAVNNDKLAATAVQSNKIPAGGISDPTDFAAGVVNGAAIAAGAIDNSNKFAAGVVDDVAIGTEEVGTGELKAAAVIASKIAAGAVAGVALADGAAHAEKIGEFEVYAPRGDYATLNDDNLTTKFPNNDHCFLFLQMHGTANGYALVAFKTGSSGLAITIAAGSQIEIVTTSDVAPVYSDFTDGKWTIAINTAADKIHFINRTGFQYQYAYTFLNGFTYV